MIKFSLVPPYVYAIALVCLVGASGAGGWKLRDADYQKHLQADARASQKATEAARNIEDKNEATAQEIGTKVEETKETIRYVTRTLIKEVPTYVTEQADDRCVVPLGAVRMLDAAATGNPEVAIAPGESPDQASGHELSGVVASVVQNYGYTRELEATVTGWQDWYERVRKDWPQ